jgi:hypothetical protein
MRRELLSAYREARDKKSGPRRRFFALNIITEFRMAAERDPQNSCDARQLPSRYRCNPARGPRIPPDRRSNPLDDRAIEDLLKEIAVPAASGVEAEDDPEHGG